jgi:hypothetical protein
MKQYKALLIGIILAVLPFNSASAIIGFGIQGGQSLFTVGDRTKSRLLTPSPLPETYATFNTGSFGDSPNIGIYLYLDIIPFIDLEVDAIINWKKYQFSFENPAGDIGPMDAYWGGASIYFTARKKIVGFELPILGGAQLFAGGGYNTHTFAPLVNLDLVESLMDGKLGSTPEFSEDALVDFIKENKIDKTGFHLQGGLKFQLMMLDAFLFYRQTIGDFEDVLDAKTYGSMNLRLGLGF